jgi:pyruvate/2-oxoglutarate dehydrogenase complex dihydrolipoamide acyltransferase (E2) component
MATEVLMPALSPTMEEGTLAKWLVKEGDTVKSGQILAEIETDKATMEFEAVDEGVIGKLLVAEGTANVKVNTPIAVLVEEGESVSASPAASSSASGGSSVAPAPVAAVAAAGAAAGSAAAGGAAAQSSCGGAFENCNVLESFMANGSGDVAAADSERRRGLDDSGASAESAPWARRCLPRRRRHAGNVGRFRRLGRRGQGQAEAQGDGTSDGHYSATSIVPWRASQE